MFSRSALLAFSHFDIYLKNSVLKSHHQKIIQMSPRSYLSTYLDHRIAKIKDLINRGGICSSPATNHSAMVIENAAEHPEESERLMRLPLLTHSDVVNRRRRELRASGEKNVDLDDNVRHLRHLQAQQLGALYQGYGTHYVDLWVGNPPQRQTAIVDTGTSATAFPCSECQNCGQHTDLPFDESKSQTFRVHPCTRDDDTSNCTFGSCSDQKCLISHNFGSGNDASSWAAFEAQDIVYAGGLHDRPIDSSSTENSGRFDDDASPLHAAEFSFPLTFGCQTSTSGYFEKQLASGVIGLDRRAQSFWGQMRAAQTIYHAQFSLCFVRQSTSGVNAGAIMFGGVDKRLHKTPMVFAKLMEDGTTAAFKVHVRKIYMRTGHSMSETIMFDTNAKYSMLQLSEEALNGKERFSIDSGTTDTYFIKSISDEFRKYWEDMTGLEYSNEPIHASDIDVKGLPTIILQMTPHEGGVGDEIKTDDPRNVPGLAGKLDLATPNDVMFAIPAKHYMQHNEKDDTYSPRIYLDRDDSLGNVLGANAMMGHDMLFDVDAARIGFAESNCDYTGLVGYDGSASVKANDGAQIGLKVDTGEDKGVCSSLQCRGVFGATLTLFFIGFFFFGRRYVNGGSTAAAVPPPVDLEMKSNRNLGSRYSDSSDHAYEDRSVESDDSDNSRGTRQSHRSHRSSHSHRSSNSHRSSRSRESHRSGVSSGSRESRRSSRSKESMRSSGSRESRRSSGSRESHRTGGSSSRDGSRDRSHSSSHRSSSGSRRHYSDRDSSRRNYRSYDDDYDNIPMPPSIT